jgi:hypothetical protein
VEKYNILPALTSNECDASFTETIRTR